MFFYFPNKNTGGLFDYNYEESTKTLQFAIKTANEEILKDADFTIAEEISEGTYGNELIASKNLCSLLEVELMNLKLFF